MTIPNTVTTLSNHVFANNPLKHVSMDVTIIPDDMFKNDEESYGTGIETVTFGNNVEIIGSNAFKNNTLVTVTCQIPSPKSKKRRSRRID